MQNTQNLLTIVKTQTEALQQARKKLAKSHAPDFYMIDSFSINENSLSQALSRLLHPKESHGQGPLYLDLFLKQFAQDIHSELDSEFDSQAFTEAEVTLEKATDSNRRIDIHLELSGKAFIGIENKPWASDQKNQLKDYADYLKKYANKKSWLLLYLCNDEPSNYSLPNEHKSSLENSKNFKTISFCELNIWLEKCLSKTKPAKVRLFIEELIYFITTQVNYIMDNFALSETTKVITENIETAFHIAQSLDNVKTTLVRQLKSQLKIELGSHEMTLLPDNDDVPNKFSIAFSTSPTQKFYLKFSFERKNFNGFVWGIIKQDSNYPSKEICQKINTIMNECFGVAENPNEWWPWSAWAETNNHFKNCLNWERNPTPWLAISDGSLVEEIVEIALKVKELFNSSDLLN